MSIVATVARLATAELLFIIAAIYTVVHKKRGSIHLRSLLWKILMDFNNFYMSGNKNKCPLQVSCLLFILHLT